jgi:hypothetical protein
MLHVKSRCYPTLATRPSVLAGQFARKGPKDGEAMINEAGKWQVKSRASAFILLMGPVAR